MGLGARWRRLLTRKAISMATARRSSSRRLEKSGCSVLLMEVAASLGSEEWALAHDALSKLSLRRAEFDAEEGKWLLRAFRAATHAHFGFASFGEYVERLFGLGRRATEEKLRVATALEELPELEQALRAGRLTWSAVREVTRVAMPNTEREWIAEVRGKTVREVERLVSGLAPGDRPKDPRRWERVRHVLRFEVGVETLATFREAMRLLRKRSDHRLNEDEALLSMAREILGGPRDTGRAGYQVVVTQCEDCGRGFQQANGELIQLDPAIVEMCGCDAQKIEVARSSAGEGIGKTDDDVAPAGENANSDAHVGQDDDSANSDAHGDAADRVAPNDAHMDASLDVAGARRTTSERTSDTRRKEAAAGRRQGLKRPRATGSCRHRLWPMPAPRPSRGSRTSDFRKRPRARPSTEPWPALPKTHRQIRCCAPPSLTLDASRR